MAQLTSAQYRYILQRALNICGGSPVARARIEQLMNELTDGEWDHRRFFTRLAGLLGPIQDEIPVLHENHPVGNFRYKDAIALMCVRIMIHEIRIPDQHLLSPFVIPLFRQGIWFYMTTHDIVRVVPPPPPVPPEPLEPPEPEVPLPVINIPDGQTDIITYGSIPDGTRMVDFHGEKAMHRYYTEATYNSIPKPERKPYKENPYTRKPILPADLTRYIAKLDKDMEVQQAGRRKTRKSKKRKTKTRRVRKTRRRNK